MTTAEFKKAARERLNGKTRDELIYTVDNENVSGWDRQTAADMLRDLDHFQVIARLDAIKEPNWTTTPVFWLTLVAAAAAIVGAYFAGISVLRPRPSDAVAPPSSTPTQPPAGPQSRSTQK